MKAIRKILLATAFVAAAFSFVACSDDDDDDGVTTTATFKGTDEDGGELTVTFKSDKTYVIHEKMSLDFEKDSLKLVFDLDFESGTYTGDPTKAGDVKLKATKENYSNVDEALSDENSAAYKKVAAAAQKGDKSVTFTNSDFPLKTIDAADQTEETYTIDASGKVVIEDDEEKITLTRQ